MLSGMIQLSVCTFYYIVVDTVSQSRSLMDVYVIVRLEKEEDNFFCHVLMNLFKENSSIEWFSSFDIDVVKRENQRMLFRTNIIVSSAHFSSPLLNEGRSSTLMFGKRTFKCRLCAFEHELYERKRLKYFSLSLFFLFTHSSLSLARALCSYMK